jgi:ATP-dependent DNA helicase RecG
MTGAAKAPLTLDTDLVTALGKTNASALDKQFGMATVRDLVYHFPRRYDERGEQADIGKLQIGEHVTVLGRVERVVDKTFPNKKNPRIKEKMRVVTISDGTHGGRLTLTFFGKLVYATQGMVEGRWGLFAGKVTDFRGNRQLGTPQFQMLSVSDKDEAEDAIEEFAGALIPIYPATKELNSWNISKLVGRVLKNLGAVDDPLPISVRADRNLMSLRDALREIHRPDSRPALEAARKRLKWDEAFAVQLTLVQRRNRAALWPGTPRPPRASGLLDKFDGRLPYELTKGQQRVGAEIAADLARAHPMHRLLQGEVGSGKTVCALRAMLQVVDSGGQAAMLAPTEVLAVQHLRSLQALLGPLSRAGELDGDPDGTRLAFVSGSLSASARRAALQDIASGDAKIIVGTHALLYEGVDFDDLGLVVVDEQHRFGVEQRDALRAKAHTPPHVLVMTATPIPRTVAMTVFGDLDTSTLSELPLGRSPIASHVVPAADKPTFLDRAWRRIREEVGAGHQAYVVCPRIGADSAEEPGEDLEETEEETRRPPLAVTEVAPLLADGPLHGLRIEVLHGRLPTDEKDAVMRSFAAGGIDVLVATTVIEVGVDVANATVMMVLDADRFGVSQLHQLRGRVGRGSAPGLCLLVTEASEETPARERLDAVAATLDGFRLAEIDLEQRREGDVLGAAQSGRQKHLQLLSLKRDEKLIVEARTAAAMLLDDDPELDGHPDLKASIAALVDDERAEYLNKG